MGGVLDYRRIFEHAPDAVLVVSPDGRVIDANPAAEAFLGYDRSELVTTRISTLIAPLAPGVPDDGADAHAPALGERGPSRRIFVRSDGSRVAGEVARTRLPSAHGDPGLTVVAVRDVSRRVPEERGRAEAEDRLQTLGALAGGIAHDFNNILASIVGFAELAREQVPSDSDAARDLDRALKASDQAGRLIEQILAFGRRGEDDRRPVDLEQAIVGVARLVRSSLPPGADLEISSDHSHTVVSGDETRLQQIVLNLCSNAGKALGSGPGTVRVTIETVDLAEPELGLAPGRYVALSVQDDGPGVPEELRDWIFEPYVSTRTDAGGTGLGLSVVKSIVESHGGVIRLVDAERGAHFRVLLPACSGAAEEREGRVHDPQGGRGTVLVLDDSAELVEIATRRLSDAGYTVMASEDVYDALQLVNVWGHEIDLVVTDHSMPGMTGTAFLRRAREAGLACPAVMLTGADPSITGAELGRLGIDEVVGKPLPGHELVRLVDRLARRRGE